MDTRFFTEVLFWWLFIFYASGDNNAVVLIHPNTESAYTPEDEMPYEEVVDTMGDDILDEMEWKNGNICDDSDSRCGEEHKFDDGT